MQNEKNKNNNETSYFDEIEARRYKKLKNAPDTAGKVYPELNLDGCTQEEILFGFKK